MRVRDDSDTKNHLSVIIEVFRPLLKKGKVISWQSKRIRSHIRSGCVSITSSSPLSIEEKLFIIQYTVNLCIILKQPYNYKGTKTMQGQHMPEHVYIPAGIPPKLSASQFTGYLKAKNCFIIQRGIRLINTKMKAAL